MIENNVRERIINVLIKHPEGLTLLNISNLIGMNRVTISKYVYGLIAEDMIYQKKIGPAKLCYLKKMVK
jgi:DNA-binding IclR family transcriptional regulator